MKRLLLLSLIAAIATSLSAQYNGDGYYRVHNKATKRYIYLLDNTGSINVQTTSADMGAVETHRDTARIHYDPACIIYVQKVSTTEEKYDLRAQGTGVHDIIGYYVTVYPRNDYYQVYAEGQYLDDHEQANVENGQLGTNLKGDYRNWYIDRVNNTDQYFGILPTIQLGNKYYKPFYASFPFTVSAGMKVFYISAVHNTAAIISEATGVIPAATPVFIECNAPHPSGNKITIGGTASASVTSNKLGGVYFNNPNRKKSAQARTAYKPATMRTLAVSPEGKLCFVKNFSLAYLLANESYLQVPATAADTLPVMTAAEYAVYSKVASVTLDQTTLSLQPGQTATLTATVLPATAVNKKLNWTSTNTAVATVDSLGQVTALSVGNATIKAASTDGTNISATCQVTVNPIIATGLTLSRGLFSGIEGDTAKLTVTFVPANTTYQQVTWSSSNPAVATVTGGLITITGIGMATVTATTTDGSNLSATCSVVGNPILAASISLSRTTFAGIVGDTTTLNATVLPTNTTNPTVRWTSSDTTVATVQAGKITLCRVGSATVTVSTTDGSNLSATCQITVNPVLATNLILSCDSIIGIAGDTATLWATVLPDNTTDKSVTWTSSNPAVATVSGGFITLLSVGSATVTAATIDGSNLTATCQIRCQPVMVSMIQITGAPKDPLRINDRLTLSATALPDNATSKALTWESSDPSVLRILSQSSTACNLQALTAGETVITATARDGSDVFAQTTVIVRPTLAEALTLAQDSVLLSIGDSLLLPYTILPDETTDKSVAWTSSDTTVLTVSNRGLCRAVDAGDATVTVSTLDGSNLSASCLIHVADTVIPPTLAQSILLSRTAAEILLGQTLTLTCTVLPLETTDKSVTWTSSDTTVLTVDNNGLCRARAVGTAVITVSTLDGSGLTATCAVTVNPILVESISLSLHTQTLHVGESFALTCTTLPVNATDPSFRWSSSNPTVLSVDSTGFCTALSLGTAHVIVTTLDGSALTDSCRVSVTPILASSLTISRSQAALHVGDTISLSYTLLPLNVTDPSILWSSSDASVVSVDSLGICTALGIGSATVTVSALDGSGLTASCLVRVDPIKVTSISISQSGARMHIDDTLTLSCTILPLNATDPSVRWTSSDGSIVSVDNSGRCHAHALGMALVYAATVDGSSLMAFCTVTVTPRLADSIAVSPQSLTLTIGDTTSLSAQVFPATTANPTVLWESAAPAIVRVDKKGHITAVGVGETTVTASTADGTNLRASCLITVEPVWVTAILLSADTFKLYIEESATLTATVLPDNATYRQLSWQSLDETIATVSAEGRVTGHQAGTTTVIATSAYGPAGDLSAECVIEVKLFDSLPQTLASEPDKHFIFDILGRRLSSIPGPGLYIIDGKKIYITR